MRKEVIKIIKNNMREVGIFYSIGIFASDLAILGAQYASDCIIDFYTKDLISKAQDPSLFYVISCSVLLMLDM